MTDLLFVYGTLQPGEVRWHFLEPFVVDDLGAATVSGALYETGHAYPAAVFGSIGVVHGAVYRLHSVDHALDVLDRVESAVDGLYVRVRVATDHGWAWAYECGDDRLLVQRLDHGNWKLRTG
jgi:gamma-glutamylcyclotransferase (GGCT)/AIG2-like uncharacterized protein YtfP